MLQKTYKLNFTTQDQKSIKNLLSKSNLTTYCKPIIPLFVLPLNTTYVFFPPIRKERCRPPIKTNLILQFLYTLINQNNKDYKF